jgi:hypothetical protein
MPATFLGSVLDTPDYKIFDISIPEIDAATDAVVFTFAANGQSDLRAAPQFYYSLPHTPFADSPTDTTTMSIPAVSRTGFTIMKASATVPLSGASQTFRVYMVAKRFYEV